MSQYARQRIEPAFGWLKTIAWLRKVKLRGLAKELWPYLTPDGSNTFTDALATTSARPQALREWTFIDSDVASGPVFARIASTVDGSEHI